MIRAAICFVSIIFLAQGSAFAQSITCTNAAGQIIACPIASGTSLDLSVIFQPILAVAGAVIAGLLTIYVPRALDAFQARTKIQLTDQQRATVLGAVRTAAGMIETQLDKGVLSVAHVEIANPIIRDQANAAISAVPKAMAALDMTVDGVARMIVGAVDTSDRKTTTVATTVATAPNEVVTTSTATKGTTAP